MELVSTYIDRFWYGSKNNTFLARLFMNINNLIIIYYY